MGLPCSMERLKQSERDSGEMLQRRRESSKFHLEALNFSLQSTQVLEGCECVNIYVCLGGRKVLCG